MDLQKFWLSSKTCSACGERKLLTEFYEYLGRPTSKCKPCYRKYKVDRYHALTITKYPCECGCLISKHSKNNHLKSKRHLSYNRFVISAQV